MRRPLGSSNFGSGLAGDVGLRYPTYMEDFRVSATAVPKLCGATLFMYFACLAPVVAFGGAMQLATRGQLGIRETILSRGICGMLYALFAGQPMTIIGPTGLTLAFTTALYAWATPLGIPFLPMYSWVGLWTSLFLTLASLGNAANLIRFCTRFTEDVFNAFLGTSYLFTSLEALASRCITAAAAAAAGVATAASASASALLSLIYGLLTFTACQLSATISASRYFSAEVRAFINDFGPALAVGVVSLLSLSSFSRLLAEVPRLAVPTVASGFNLGRALLVPIWTLPTRHRLLAAIPALLLAILFFLDQNITVRTVNSKENHLRRRATYHLDLLVLGLLTGLASICGLPWMCGATVESINHIRSLTSSHTIPASNSSAPATLDEGAESGSLLSPSELTLVADAFDKADKDGSNEIEPPELVALLRQPPQGTKRPELSVEEAAALTASAYQSFDKNNDGALQYGEFAAWFRDRRDAKGDAQSEGGRAKTGGFAAAVETTVLETRLSGFAVHALVLATLSFVSSLRVVPVAVVNGVFLYLGKKVMGGNQFLARVGALAIPGPAGLRSTSPAERSILTLGRRATLTFTGLQLACLGVLWALKLTPGMGMIFPAAIGGLMLVRARLLPRLFTRQQLGIIDTPFGSML